MTLMVVLVSPVFHPVKRCPYELVLGTVKLWRPVKPVKFVGMRPAGAPFMVRGSLSPPYVLSQP